VTRPLAASGEGERPRPRGRAGPEAARAEQFVRSSGGVNPGSLLPLIKQVDQAAGRVPIQTGCHDGGPEMVPAKALAQPGQCWNVLDRGCAELQPYGPGVHRVGECSVNVLARQTQVGEGSIVHGDACLITQALVDLQ